jgi:hypothetical protein
MLRFAAEPRRYKGAIVVPERELLESVLVLCRRHPKVAFAHRANTGSGYLVPARVFERLLSRGQIQRSEARFMRFGIPGMSDVIGMLRRSGRLLTIECKAVDGIVSDEQAAYLDAVNGGGGLGIVARNLDDVMRALASA